MREGKQQYLHPSQEGGAKKKLSTIPGGERAELRVPVAERAATNFSGRNVVLPEHAIIEVVVVVVVVVVVIRQRLVIVEQAR